MTTNPMKVNFLVAMTALLALALLGSRGVEAAQPEAAPVTRRCEAQADVHRQTMKTVEAVCSLKSEGRNEPCERAVRRADAAYQALYACNHPEW